MNKTIINNNSGNDNFDFSNLSLVDKYIETNLGNKGIVVKEWLSYPEPCEWLLDNGYILNEERMYWENEIIIKVVERK